VPLLTTFFRSVQVHDRFSKTRLIGGRSGIA